MEANWKQGSANIDGKAVMKKVEPIDGCAAGPTLKALLNCIDYTGHIAAKIEWLI